jgi:hypothetical protein
MLSACKLVTSYSHNFTDVIQVEHIDNPKGYPDDARQFDQRLRGPVDVRLLLIICARKPYQITYLLAT